MLGGYRASVSPDLRRVVRADGPISLATLQESGITRSGGRVAINVGLWGLSRERTVAAIKLVRDSLRSEAQMRD